MRKRIITGILLCMIGLSGCAQEEPGMTRAEYEIMMQTAEGRETAIQEVYEGAEVLSEIEMTETGCIISEFSAGEVHNVMLFKPTENGYYWGEESTYYPANKVGRVFVTIGEEMYDVFLRHNNEIAFLEVMYTHEEDETLTLKGTVCFEDSNIGWIQVTEVIPQYREELVITEIAGYNSDGQEISLKNEVASVEPSTTEKAADVLENIVERKITRLIMKGLMG